MFIDSFLKIEWVLLVSAFLWTGCSNDDLAKTSVLGSLRVLSMQTPTPEVSAGATVSLSMVVSNLDRGIATGGNLSLSYTLEGCTDPGVSVGATPSCAHDPSKTTQSGTFTLASSTYTATVALPSIVVPASLSTTYNGVNYIALVTVTGGTETTTAFKRILVSTRPTKNSNPSLSSIQINGSTITQLPSVESDLTPAIGAGAESYLEQQADGSLLTRTETLTVSWYISQGTVQYSRTDGSSSNKYTPNSSPTKAVFLVPVLRDGRGGEATLGGLTVGP